MTAGRNFVVGVVACALSWAGSEVPVRDRMT